MQAFTGLKAPQGSRVSQARLVVFRGRGLSLKCGSPPRHSPRHSTSAAPKQSLLPSYRDQQEHRGERHAALEMLVASVQREREGEAVKGEGET